MKEILEVLAALRAHDEEEEPHLGPEMRSRLLHHGRKTAQCSILLHGLTASPPTFLRMAHELHARGHTVIIPRVVRHGHGDRLTETLRDLTLDELHEFASRIMGIAEQLGSSMNVLGHSLGGALALFIAQRYPVARAVAVAPFLGVAMIPHELHGAVRRIVRALPNHFVYWDPIHKEKQRPQHGYPRYATHAIASGLELGDELRREARLAPPLAERIEIVLNASEHSVNNRTVCNLVRRWRISGANRIGVHYIRGLPPSHDVIEHSRRGNLAARVAPLLISLLLED